MTSAPPRPLRVAYLVSPSAHFAGIERVVHEVATSLALAHPAMLDVHVVYSTAYDEVSPVEAAYTVHVLGVDRLLAVGAPLRRVVAAGEFDILVTPQVEASVIAWTATRGLRLPVLLPHLHGNPRIERAEATRRTAAAFAMFAWVVSRTVPAVIAVSPSLRDHAASTLARRTRVVFAKNPVREMEDTRRVGAGDGVFRFVCVARLTRQKGQDLLLEALALARAELPTFSLTLVGAGDLLDDLRASSTRLGLDDVVHFAGYCADPAPYLRGADCFVLASRWEGFGIALIEALQCGVPLLATDCEFGPRDIIGDPVIGDLVAPDDVAALAAGLVLAAGRERTLEGDEARRAVAAGYQGDVAAATHFSVLRSVAPAV